MYHEEPEPEHETEGIHKTLSTNQNAQNINTIADNSNTNQTIQNQKIFAYQCEYGLADNIRSVKAEFNDYRGLDNVKILVSGPIASGKSMVCEKLSEMYNLPIIHIQNVIEEWLSNEFDLKVLDSEKDPYAEHREHVAKYKEELDQLTQNVQDKKKKDKKGSERPKLSEELTMLA